MWTVTANTNQASNFGFDWYVAFQGTASGVLMYNTVVNNPNSPYHTNGNTMDITSPSGHGNFYIMARLHSPTDCVSQWANLQAQTSVYDNSEFAISGTTSICPNGTGDFASTLTGAGVTNFNWTWGSTLNYISGQNSNTLWVSAPPNFNSGAVTLQLQNRCGWTGTPFVLPVTTSGCGMFMSVSPNPANSTLNVTMTPENAMTSSVDSNAQTANSLSDVSVVTTAALINSIDGSTVWSAVITTNEFKIDTSGIPNGIYYLKTDNSLASNVQRIVIKH